MNKSPPSVCAGVAEMLAMEMKSSGMYVSRGLSYKQAEVGLSGCFRLFFFFAFFSFLWLIVCVFCCSNLNWTFVYGKFRVAVCP